MLLAAAAAAAAAAEVLRMMMIKLILGQSFTLLQIAGNVFLATLRLEADHPFHLRLTRRDLHACLSQRLPLVPLRRSYIASQVVFFRLPLTHLLLDSMSQKQEIVKPQEIRRANIDGHIWYEMLMLPPNPMAGKKYYACKVLS
jgi:hypothetical protein